MPAPVSMTGILELSRTSSIRPFSAAWYQERSTYPTAFSSSAVACRSEGSNVTAFSSVPLFLSTSFITETIALLECHASCPPLSIQAFDVLKHRENTSKLTFGQGFVDYPYNAERYAYLAYDHTVGTHRFSECLPPTGVGNDATFFISAAMASILSRDSIRRSYIGSDSSMRSRLRFLFSSSIKSVFSSVLSASCKSTEYINPSSKRLSARLAERDFSKAFF